MNPTKLPQTFAILRSDLKLFSLQYPLFILEVLLYRLVSTEVLIAGIYSHLWAG